MNSELSCASAHPAALLLSHTFLVCFCSHRLLPAVLSQRIRATVNTQEQKRLLMDLDISMRTVDCFYTVTFYGALFREVVSHKQRTHYWFCVCSWPSVET